VSGFVVGLVKAYLAVTATILTVALAYVAYECFRALRDSFKPPYQPPPLDVVAWAEEITREAAMQR